MKKVLVIGIIITAIGVTGFLGYKYYKNPTKDWQYHESNQGIKLRYPKEWKIDTRTEDTNEIFYLFNTKSVSSGTDKKIDEPGTSNGDIYIMVEMKKGMSLENFANNPNTVAANSPKGDTIKEKINGYDSITYTRVVGENNPVPFKQTILELPSKFVIIADDEPLETKSVYNNILNSIRE